MKTKIIATIGPSSDSPEKIEQLALAGMDVMRCNFAHCQYDEYKARIATIKEINERHGLDVKIQADLQGPSIRLGENIPKKGIVVEEGDVLTFVTSPYKKELNGEITINDPYLHTDVAVGEPMLIESGMIDLVVSKTFLKEQKFQATVKVGGIIYPRKAVNLPGTKLTTSSLTEKDIRDLEFVLEAGVDIVAISFVGSAADIERVRAIINQRGEEASVWAKIERREALINIDEIMKAADGIIVARGDLGVEMPFEELPLIQKRLVRKSLQNLKPAIVATQMLKHMTKSPYPSRAEISDLANAIFDGAHYVWLSDETANGDYPVESVKVMRKVANAADSYLDEHSLY